MEWRPDVDGKMGKNWIPLENFGWDCQVWQQTEENGSDALNITLLSDLCSAF